MTQPYRTAAGGRIDRDRPIRFSFDNRMFEGYAGDTLASALLANGVHLVGRSFKYHRPRGILSAGAEEPNALVTIDRGVGRVTPNLRATTVELYDGLVARSQNAWPSVRFDLGAVAGALSRVLGAGFYYKTFMWPASYWQRLYEPVIRAAAGLGRAPEAPDPDRYLHRYAHCDMLVVGSGPAGLAAASAAAARGQQVILCDEQAEAGGSLLVRPGDFRIDGRPASAWIAEATAGYTVLTRTTAFGWYPDNMIALLQRVTDHLREPGTQLPRERLWLVRAKRVVIATGAIERPAVFPGNDRPGIMLAGSAATYLYRYGVLPGQRIVVATSHDSAWYTAFALAAAGGAMIAAILERRADVDPGLRDKARAFGIPVHAGARITGTGGRTHVRFVRTDAAPGTVHCDTVLMSDGWTPTVHLFSQSRGKLRFDPDSGTFLPGPSAAAEQSAGACAGAFDVAACLAEGHRAGGGSARTFAVTGAPAFGVPLPPTPAPTHGRAFVDFQNDVTTKDLAIATGEGFRAIEHVKRYTTAGMATDQGKTANLNALATVAALTGRTVPEIGLTTFRPPYTPVTFGAFAGASRGDLFEPVRRTPIDDADAVFEDVGTWKRAHHFPRPGETMHQAVARECLAVRHDLGLFDASTLGKIEVVGPDAAAFLNRMYTGDFTRLAPGRCKYGVLLGEDGFIRDDGVIARLAPDRFHVTTTTGGAAGVLHQMEDYLQTEFTSLRVSLTSITEQWAVIALQGPRAAEALTPFLDGIDLTTMPHMSVREGRFAGVPTRLFRVSFTGETGFEINLPADFARAAWALLARHRSNPLRYRDDARPARRERLRHHRPGDRRHGHSRRPRSQPHDREEQTGLRRQAVARPARHDPGRSQATGWAAVRRRPGGGRATDRRRHRFAGSRDVGVSQRGAEPADRAGSAVERPVPDRNEIAGAAFARRCRRDRHRADILRSGRETNEPGHWVGGTNRRRVGRRRPVDNACRGGDADRHDVGRGNANASAWYADTDRQWVGLRLLNDASDRDGGRNRRSAGHQ